MPHQCQACRDAPLPPDHDFCPMCARKVPCATCGGTTPLGSCHVDGDEVVTCWECCAEHESECGKILRFKEKR